MVFPHVRRSPEREWSAWAQFRRGRKLLLASLIALAGIVYTSPALAQTTTCTVLDADGGTGPNQLYANCPSGLLRLGEATEYSNAVNGVAGLIVVRQTGLGTEVDRVTISPDGKVHLDELSNQLREQFAEAHAGRPQRFTVDLSAFEQTGTVTAKAMASSIEIKVNLLASVSPGAAS